VESLRLRRIRSMVATLLLSQGVPMILMGDECRRTQNGNNNAYCQDNEISWFNWALLEKNGGLHRFCRELIHFRRSEPAVRQANFLRGLPHRPGGLPDISWFDASGRAMDWSGGDDSIACALAALPDPPEPTGRHLLMLFHNGGAPKEFAVPPGVLAMPWRLFVDTAAESPADIYPDCDGPAPPSGGVLVLQPSSMLVYVARG
jgi:isoamylase